MYVLVCLSDFFNGHRLVVIVRCSIRCKKIRVVSKQNFLKIKDIICAVCNNNNNQ
jgi:hypothetical protein